MEQEYISYYLSSKQQRCWSLISCTFVVRIWHKTHFSMTWPICNIMFGFVDNSCPRWTVWLHVMSEFSVKLWLHVISELCTGICDLLPIITPIVVKPTIIHLLVYSVIWKIVFLVISYNGTILCTCQLQTLPSNTQHPPNQRMVDCRGYMKVKDILSISAVPGFWLPVCTKLIICYETWCYWPSTGPSVWGFQQACDGWIV